MSDFMSYDPWRKVSSRNGIQGDLLISALQKSIRRGLAEEAITFAYEMYITSPQFEEKLWRRLQAIAVEDVGFGDLSAPVLINALNQMRQNFPYTDGDRPIFFVHAIRFLAAAKKDRTSDNLKNIIITNLSTAGSRSSPISRWICTPNKATRWGGTSNTSSPKAAA